MINSMQIRCLLIGVSLVTARLVLVIVISRSYLACEARSVFLKATDEL